MNDKARKSLEQMSVEAAEVEGIDPWACRLCGCRMWSTKDSRPRGEGPRRRLKICRNCGEPITTYELPVPPGHKLAVLPEAHEPA